MARQKDAGAAKELGDKLTDAIDRRHTNPAALYNRIIMQTGNRVVTSVQHLRDMADGKVDPNVANLNLLASLLRVLDLEPDGLGEVVEERISLLLATVGHGPDGGSDLDVSPTRWTGDVVDIGTRRKVPPARTGVPLKKSA